MKYFLNDLITTSIYLLLFTIIAYLLGNILYNLIRKNEINEYKSFFWKIAIGLISTVVIFAMVKTKLLTMYMGAVITIIFYLYQNKIKFELSPKIINLKLEKEAVLVYCSILLISIIGVNYLFHFDNRLFSNYDLAYYSKIGYALYDRGKETMNSEAVQIGPINANIYHYFNEWLTAIFLGFSKFTSLKAFLLLALPLQIAVIGFGAFTIAKSFLKKYSKLKIFLISFLIFIIPAIIGYLLNILIVRSFQTPYSILHSGLLNLKTKIITIFILLFLVNFRTNIKTKNYLSISLIPLFWNSLIPAFLGGYILYALYNIYNRKKNEIKLFCQFLIPIIYIPVHLLLFNLFNNHDNTEVNLPKEYGLLNYMIDTYSQPIKLLQTILIWIVPLILFFLLIILKFGSIFDKLKQKYSVIKDEQRTIFILSLFITLSGLFTFGLLRDIYNARQAITILFYPIFCLLLYALLLLILKQKPKLFLTTIISIYLLIGINLYTDTSYQYTKVAELSKKIESPEPGNQKILIASDIQKKQFAFSLYQKPYAFLLMNNENFNPIKLNIIWPTEKMNPKEKFDYYFSVQNQPFYKYMKTIESNYNIDKAKEEFIKEYKINYLLIDSNTLKNKPTYLNNLNIDEKVLFDKEIYLLKFKS